jgi:threonine synthase
MDIEVSSNFERLLFAAEGGDAAAVRAHMGALAQSGGYTLAPAVLAAIRAEFDAGRADEAEVAATIRRVWGDAGYMLDPHTAVAVAVAEKAAGDPATPRVVLATAHPAKFPDAVEAATGRRPALPPYLDDLHLRRERVSVVPNDLAAVQAFVAAHSRARREEAA